MTRQTSALMLPTVVLALLVGCIEVKEAPIHRIFSDAGADGTAADSGPAVVSDTDATVPDGLDTGPPPDGVACQRNDDCRHLPPPLEQSCAGRWYCRRGICEWECASGECEPGQRRDWLCSDGRSFPWCTCSSQGAWDCREYEQDPCLAGSFCQELGGFCVGGGGEVECEMASLIHEPAQDPLGCEEVCCLPVPECELKQGYCTLQDQKCKAGYEPYPGDDAQGCPDLSDSQPKCCLPEQLPNPCEDIGGYCSEQNVVCPPNYIRDDSFGCPDEAGQLVGGCCRPMMKCEIEGGICVTGQCVDEWFWSPEPMGCDKLGRSCCLPGGPPLCELVEGFCADDEEQCYMVSHDKYVPNDDPLGCPHVCCIPDACGSTECELAGGYCTSTWGVGCEPGFSYAPDLSCTCYDNDYDQFCCLPNESCQTDLDCPDGYVCEKLDPTFPGECVEGCYTVDDCPMEWFVNCVGYWECAGGRCQTVCSSPCVNQSDCQFNEVCVDQNCFGLRFCSSSDQCRDNEFCSEEGLCLGLGSQCRVDHECGWPEMICSGGVCLEN